MPDINLLPENLRQDGREKNKSREEEIQYSNPEKFKIYNSEIPPVKNKKSGPGFLARIKSWREKRKSLKQSEKEEVGLYRVNKSVEPEKVEAIHGIPPDPPKIWPQKNQEIKSVAPPPPPKQPEVKPAPVVEKKILPEQKMASTSFTNGNGRRFHQPQEKVSPGFEVDLYTDKTLLFSPTDLLNKLKVGVIVILLLFILMGSAYLLLIRYQPASPSDSDLDAQISAQESKLANYEKQKKDVVEMDSLLQGLNQAISGHLYWSKLFTFLEANTVADVYYNNLAFDKDGGINLAVSAKDYTAMAEQLAVFQNSPEVEKVDFDAAYLSEENVVTQQAGKNVSSQFPVVKATIGLYLKQGFFTQN